MNRIKVVAGTLALHEGAVVQLTNAQVAPRRHKLEPIKGRRGTFMVRDQVQFKAGEQLAVDDLAPSQAAQVEFFEPQPAPGA